MGSAAGRSGIAGGTVFKKLLTIIFHHSECQEQTTCARKPPAPLGNPPGLRAFVRVVREVVQPHPSGLMAGVIRQHAAGPAFAITAG
jgi:hypothetical protein